MSQDEGFLRAILEEPDDDGLRLIYADWLEERGDPRAEFIRVQCGLATLPPGDDRRPSLEARERALLTRHGTRWVRPLRRFVSGWEFRRGFVERVAVAPRTFLNRAECLFGLAPIRQVDLRMSLHRLGDAGALALAGCRFLERAVTLDLTAASLTPRGVQALARSPHL